MELTNQVATLQDEVKLLKGEIKSILKEIRTAVLSRDNPFSVGLEAVQVPNEQSRESTPAQEPALPAAEPKPIEPAPIVRAPLAPAPPALGPLAPAFQVPAAPQMTPMPQMNSPQPPIVNQGGAPPAPNWAGPVPASQPAPAPFTPSAAPASLAPPIKRPEPEAPAKSAQRAETSEAPEDDEPEEMEAEEPANEPIPIRSAEEQIRPAKKQLRRAEQQDEQSLDEDAAPVRERPAWSLPTIAGLAVWAEDALVSLGPRRFQFVLELATFAELLTSDAREVLASLIDADTLSHEEERPLNVNECLVVLRQLEAIVHGEKVVKLPRRRGIRHRRIR